MGSQTSSPSQQEAYEDSIGMPGSYPPAWIPVEQWEAAEPLELILKTTPLLRDIAIYHLQEANREREHKLLESVLSQRRGFLTTFYATSAPVIAGHLLMIEYRGIETKVATTIERLAILLGGLIDDFLVSGFTVKSLGQPIEKLRALYRGVLEPIAQTDKVDKYAQFFCANPAIQYRTALRELEEIIDVLVQHDGEVMIQEPLPTDFRPLCSVMSLGEFAECIFSALSCCACQIIHADSEAMLRLGSYRQMIFDDESREICILVSYPELEGTWLEAMVHDMSGTRLGPVWRRRNPRQYSCLCKTAKGHVSLIDTHSLNITFQLPDLVIESHKLSDRNYKSDTLLQQISLKELMHLQPPTKPWRGTTKLVLGLILTYSLFYLYGGQWATGRWSRKNIVFLQSNGRIPLRPFLRSDKEGVNGPLDDEDGFHGFPEILELGVILLEIQIGQSLDSYHPERPSISSHNDLLATASEIYIKERANMMSLGLKVAIERCLQADIDQEALDQNSTVRKWLLKEVIQPIESEITRTFSDTISMNKLDEQAEAEHDLAPRHRESSTGKPPVKEFPAEIRVAQPRKDTAKVGPWGKKIMYNYV